MLLELSCLLSVILWSDYSAEYILVNPRMLSLVIGRGAGLTSGITLSRGSDNVSQIYIFFSSAFALFCYVLVSFSGRLLFHMVGKRDPGNSFFHLPILPVALGQLIR